MTITTSGALSAICCQVTVLLGCRARRDRRFRRRPGPSPVSNCPPPSAGRSIRYTLPAACCGRGRRCAKCVPVAGAMRSRSRDRPRPCRSRRRRARSSQDVVEGVGTERDDLGGGAENPASALLDLAQRDGADFALVLGDDQIRRGVAELVLDHAVDRQSVADQGPDLRVDLAERPLGSIFARVRAGRAVISAGKSHSCETPTRRSPRPRAQTISVALGSRVAMRRAIALASQRFRASRDGATEAAEIPGAARSILSPETVPQRAQT